MPMLVCDCLTRNENQEIYAFCHVSVTGPRHLQSKKSSQDHWENGQSEYIWWNCTRCVPLNSSCDTVLNYSPIKSSSCYTFPPSPLFMHSQISNTMRMTLMSSGLRRAHFSLCGSSNMTKPKDCLSLPSAGMFVQYAQHYYSGGEGLWFYSATNNDCIPINVYQVRCSKEAQ